MQKLGQGSQIKNYWSNCQSWLIGEFETTLFADINLKTP